MSVSSNQFHAMCNHSCMKLIQTSYFSVCPIPQAFTNRNSQILHPAHYGIFVVVLLHDCGPGSSVSIVTDYRLDGLGSKPGGDKIFSPSRPALGARPRSCKMGTRSFLAVKCGQGMLLTTIPPPTLWATPRL